MKHLTALLTCSIFAVHVVCAAPGAADPPVLADAPPAAIAEPAPSALQKFAYQDYLFGNWGGYRPKLKERGVDFEFLYIASVPWNLSGGIETGANYQGALLMTLDLDSEKLAGYHGGLFHAGGLWLHGSEKFSDRHIGDFNKVNLIDFENAFRLWELWYDQKFLQDKVSVRGGHMVVDRDFLVAQYYTQLGAFTLWNQAFFYPTLAFNVWDIPGFPVGHHSLNSSPYGAPGLRVRVDPVEQFYAQAAVYDGLPDQSEHGTRVHLDEKEGALSYFEVGYRLNQRPTDQGLPGNFKLGAFYHSDDFSDNRSVLTGGPPETHSGTYGVYLLIDQILYREVGKDDMAQQGLAGFFRVAGAPPDRNLTQLEISGGVVYRGLIPGRDWDSIALAGSYIEISDDIVDAVRDVNAVAPGTFSAVPDYEGVVELSYRAQMTAWWALQASIQRAIHPAGKAAGNIPDAWALVLASTLRF